MVEGVEEPDGGLLKLESATNSAFKKLRYSKCGHTFRYMFKAGFVTLASFESPVGIPFLKGDPSFFLLLLFLAQSREDPPPPPAAPAAPAAPPAPPAPPPAPEAPAAPPPFFLGLCLSSSLCSLRSCSLFCLCSAARCCCRARLGIRPGEQRRERERERETVTVVVTVVTVW